MSAVQFAPATDDPVIRTPKYHVSVEKNTKGHNWKVSVNGDTSREVIEELDRIYAHLNATYGNE